MDRVRGVMFHPSSRMEFDSPFTSRTARYGLPMCKARLTPTTYTSMFCNMCSCHLLLMNRVIVTNTTDEESGDFLINNSLFID